MIYLDHNSTTAISKAVVEKMNEIYNMGFINPSAVHACGVAAKRCLTEAKQRILSSLNASSDYDCIFTASATEANNLALNGKYIVTTKTEHESVLNIPCDTVFLDVDAEGFISIKKLRGNAINDRTISVIWANNQTGVVQNMAQIIENKAGCHVHTDGTQYIGKRFIDLSRTPVDALTFCGHKIHGPHGIGCLIFKRSFAVKQTVYGGAQEDGLRPGTYNLPAIVGLSYAVMRANDNEYLKEYQSHTQRMIDIIIDFAEKNGGVVLPRYSDKISNTVCIAKPGVLNSEQVMLMDLNNICVSIGSACSAGLSKTKNHVLEAMGFDDSLSSCAIRVSVGMETIRSEIEEFCRVWKSM